AAITALSNSLAASASTWWPALLSAATWASVRMWIPRKDMEISLCLSGRMSVAPGQGFDGPHLRALQFCDGDRGQARLFTATGLLTQFVHAVDFGSEAALALVNVVVISGIEGKADR